MSLALLAVSALTFGTIIIDRSASMETQRDDGSTRCSFAVSVAETAAREFFAQSQGRGLNVKVFGDTADLRSLTGGFVNQAAALAAIQALKGQNCSLYATALGDALCRSIDEIRAYGQSQTGSRKNLAIYVMTDGQENMSAYCGGSGVLPNSQNYYVSRQWHDAVWQKAYEGNEPVAIAAHIYWPEASEDNQDFNFLKYLSLTTSTATNGGPGGGAYSIVFTPGGGSTAAIPAGALDRIPAKASAFKIITDDSRIPPKDISVWAQ